MQITTRHRVKEIGSNIIAQLNSDIEKYISASLALDESKDIGSKAQLLTFIKGVTEDFRILEEVFAMISLKDQMRGLDLCNAMSDAIEKVTGSGLPLSV